MDQWGDHVSKTRAVWTDRFERERGLLIRFLHDLADRGEAKLYAPPETLDSVLAPGRFAWQVAIAARHTLRKADRIERGRDDSRGCVATLVSPEYAWRVEAEARWLRAEVWEILKSAEEVAHTPPLKDTSEDFTAAIGEQFSRRAQAAIFRAEQVRDRGKEALETVDEYLRRREPQPDTSGISIWTRMLSPMKAWAARLAG